MKYKKGSIITKEYLSQEEDIMTHIRTISIVEKVRGTELYCRDSICSVNNQPWVHTKLILAGYEGEVMEDLRLVEGDEFDIIIDTGLIDRQKLKNL